VSTSFRDRLVWDADRGDIHDRDIPYLLIRPDSLMGIFQFLPEGDRAAAFEAFARSIAHFGRGSAESYQALGADHADALLMTIADTAPQLGWGIWRFTRDGEDMLSLSVENSPFAAGYGESDVPVCAPIRGMLEAVGGIVYGVDMAARETACAATGASRCTFDLQAVSAGAP
jgi:uncharacterized protein